MDNMEAVKDAILKLDGENNTFNKISAVNNKVRLSILEILRDFHDCNLSENNAFKKDCLVFLEIVVLCADINCDFSLISIFNHFIING